MDWTKIASDIGVVGIISGLIVWLIKQLGQRLIDKDIKSYELELQNKSDLFKAELNHTFEEFKTELEFISQKAHKLHDKRLDKIEKIYSLLTDFYNDMYTLTTWKVVTGMEKEEIEKQNFENTQKAEKSGREFLEYYSKHKLYFNNETCSLIDEIIELLKDSYSDFSFKYIFGPISAEFEYERVKKATAQIREKVPEVRTKLEKNFRDIIGVAE